MMKIFSITRFVTARRMLNSKEICRLAHLNLPQGIRVPHVEKHYCIGIISDQSSSGVVSGDAASL